MLMMSASCERHDHSRQYDPQTLPESPEGAGMAAGVVIHCYSLKDAAGPSKEELAGGVRPG
jgi:hypothetical protein